MLSSYSIVNAFIYITTLSYSPICSQLLYIAPATQNAKCENNILCKTLFNFDTLKVSINNFLWIFLVDLFLQSSKNTILYRPLTRYTNQLPKKTESNKSWCKTIFIVAIAVLFLITRKNQYNVRSRRRPKPDPFNCA